MVKQFHINPIRSSIAKHISNLEFLLKFHSMASANNMINDLLRNYSKQFLIVSYYVLVLFVTPITSHKGCRNNWETLNETSKASQYPLVTNAHTIQKWALTSVLALSAAPEQALARHTCLYKEGIPLPRMSATPTLEPNVAPHPAVTPHKISLL